MDSYAKAKEEKYKRKMNIRILRYKQENESLDTFYIVLAAWTSKTAR